MALSRKPVEIVNQGNHQLLIKASHWERVPLSDVAIVQNGFAFKSELFTHSEGKPLIRIRDIEDGWTESFYSGEYSDGFVVRKGDILIGMDGDFNTAIWQGVDGLLNQRVCRLIPTSNKFSDKLLFLCLQPYLNAINAETSSVTRAGPRVRVGVCCLIRTVRGKLMNCDKAYRIRAMDSICRSDYLEAVLNSPRTLDVIEKIKSGINDSGVNLNQGAFLGLAIPFCSLEEQRTLIQELESKLSEADQLDETLTTSLQQAEALRQSILKKAFAGLLVPQDPHDEPASTLLARIQAERAVGAENALTAVKPRKSGKV